MQRHETSEFDDLNELSKDELISRLKEKEAALKETEAALEKQEAHAEATRKKHEALTSAAREKFTSVINDLNNEKEDLQKKLKKPGAANADNFADSSMAVNGKHGPHHSMIYYRTTKTIYLEIHEDPGKFLESLTEGWTASGDKFIQMVLKEITEDNETIVHWTLEDQNKNSSINLLLRLKVERDANGEIRIAVESIEEKDLDTTCLQVPEPATAKASRLLLSGGSITLKPLLLGRTSFTITAQADLRSKEQFNAVDNAPSRGAGLIDNLKTGFGNKSASSRVSAGSGTAKRGDSIKTGELLSNVVGQFYKRFEKEAVIDERRKKDFIDNIPNAPPLTQGEQNLIAESMKVVEEVSSKAKRVAGTASESVEKYIYHSEEGGAGVAMTVAKVDLSAVSLFAELWLLDTYALKAEKKSSKIREIWNNLNGMRGLQFTVSVALPGGFQDRLFESWMTWETMIDREGRRTFIIAFAPLKTYAGTHHEVAGAENMVEGTSKGVFIIKELTENTCEWTRAQQANLKFSSSMPVSALEFLTKLQMSYANEVQKKFRRNGKEVDRERVAALAGKMIERRGKLLMEDQAAALESTSQDVEMSMKYLPPEKGERTVATGKAVGVVDCSAEEVAAWAMDYCNNEGMRKSKEIGNPAALELREKARVNERTFATVKKMPFILDNREFVFRMIWKSEDGKVLVGIESDEKVDAAERKELATLMRESWEDEVYSEEENGLLEHAGQKFEVSAKEGGWKQLKSPDVFVKMESIYEEGSSAAVAKAITVVDATVEDCAAWEKAKLTREMMRSHHSSGGLERKVGKLNNHSELYYQAIDFGVASFAPREWLTKVVWKVVDKNTMVVGYEDVEDDNYPIGAGKGYVRSSAGTFWKYERLNEENGVPQTRVTYCQQADLKGFIPKFVVNSRVVQALGYLSMMRKKFDKSLEIDAGRRAEIMKKIKREEAGRADALAQFESLFEEKKGRDRPSRSFGKADVHVQADAVGGKGWGSTSMNVRVEMEEAAAFFWDFGSRANMEISRDVERTFEEDEEDEEGAVGFKRIVKRRQQMSSNYGGHHRDRSFASEMALQRADNDKIIILVVPLSDKDKYKRTTVVARGSVSSGNVGAIEAKETVAIQLRRLGGGRTKLEFACDIELGFGASRRAVKHFVERRLEEMIGVSIYFQRLVPLKEYRAEDGIALAQDLLWMAPSANKRVERLKEVLTRSRAMRELTEMLPWFEAMMITAVRGNLNLNKAVSTKMVCVSEKEAVQIGRNLMPALKSRKLAEAGVDQWRVQNRAVRELMKKYDWFEPMVVVIRLKAPLDAYRVASGTEQEKDTEFDPMMEMIIGKCTEMFAESIPGIVIQTSAIIHDMNSGGSISMTTYLSLAVSILTTGFVSATLSYDYDTDPKMRAIKPDFYGYVPDNTKKRAALFVTMALMSAVQVLTKGILVVTVGFVEEIYALLYLIGDILLFLIYKVVQRDFRYWIKIDGATGLAISLAVRVIVKFIVDFAAIIHYRHPYEIGGLYFTLNMFLPLVGLAAILSSDLLTLTKDTIKLLTRLTVVLGISLILLVGLFFALMNGEYRHTFFSVETGGEMRRRLFLEGDDKMKYTIFEVTREYWSPIGDKVEAWVRAGWKSWEQDKPEWFTDNWKAMVPKEMIPEKGSEEAVTVESEEKKDVVVTVEEAQGGPRKSLIETFIKRKNNNKIVPEGMNKGNAIDVEEFKREMKQRDLYM
ncbi:hypothetical protein TL16_g06036 [Triparma laevis f. inornata]|uniref:Uncharacterized protein n=1 Tax=Triparma laevis f. inornata TaxID=1714386 RepID=A0A9W7EBI9_9STRA|nr:hypothetical protein TL16_g06036 [Triparma laevis f. inornata]